jgi:hypothetical protein
MLVIDPKGTYEAARGHAHRARKSTGRLVVSGLGFSVAYFFDPDHGSARRKHAIEVIHQVRRAQSELRWRRNHATAPTRLDAEGAAPLRSVTTIAR